MARVPITELIFRGFNPVRTAAGRSVYVLTRGNEEAEVFGSELGEDSLTQPLTTNAAGLPVGSDGQQAWVAEGSYYLSIGEELSPFEAVKGGSAQLAEEQVSTAYIAEGSVTTSKLAAAAVSKDKLSEEVQTALQKTGPEGPEGPEGPPSSGRVFHLYIPANKVAGKVYATEIGGAPVGPEPNLGSQLAEIYFEAGRKYKMVMVARTGPTPPKAAIGVGVAQVLGVKAGGDFLELKWLGPIEQFEKPELSEASKTFTREAEITPVAGGFYLVGVEIVEKTAELSECQITISIE